MEIKTVKIESGEFKLIRYNGMWVFPAISTYEYGLGSPIAMILYSLDGDWLEPYTVVTVNLPDCERNTGCQFIDTNNNGSYILDWLEESGFGKRTGKNGISGFCTYPEFDFYKGENFHEYRNISILQEEQMFNI